MHPFAHKSSWATCSSCRPAPACQQVSLAVTIDARQWIPAGGSFDRMGSADSGASLSADAEEAAAGAGSAAGQCASTGKGPSDGHARGSCLGDSSGADVERLQVPVHARYAAPVPPPAAAGPDSRSGAEPGKGLPNPDARAALEYVAVAAPRAAAAAARRSVRWLLSGEFGRQPALLGTLPN